MILSKGPCALMHLGRTGASTAAASAAAAASTDTTSATATAASVVATSAAARGLAVRPVPCRCRCCRPGARSGSCACRLPPRRVQACARGRRHDPACSCLLLWLLPPLLPRLGLYGASACRAGTGCWRGGDACGRVGVEVGRAGQRTWGWGQTVRGGTQ